jgi:hypothetical protein
MKYKIVQFSHAYQFFTILQLPKSINFEQLINLKKLLFALLLMDIKH